MLILQVFCVTFEFSVCGLVGVFSFSVENFCVSGGVKYGAMFDLQNAIFDRMVGVT